jgi:hypothetical protein
MSSPSPSPTACRPPRTSKSMNARNTVDRTHPHVGAGSRRHPRWPSR